MIFYVKLSKADVSTPSLQAQIVALAGQSHEDVEVLEPYGVTANPDGLGSAGLLGIGAYLNQNADSPVVLGWLDKAHRPTNLEPGEVCFYSMHGQTILLDKNGQVTVESLSGSKMFLNTAGEIVLTPSAGTVKINGSLTVSQGITAATSVSAPLVTASAGMSVAGKNLLTHTHPNPEGGSVGPMP